MNKSLKSVSAAALVVALGFAAILPLAPAYAVDNLESSDALD